MTVKVQNTDMNSERQKALENAMHQITREFGAGAIMRLGDMKGKLDTEVIPTGSLALDIAVGVGGYPRERQMCIRDRHYMPLLKHKKIMV